MLIITVNNYSYHENMCTHRLDLAQPSFIIFCVLGSTLAGEASTYQDTLTFTSLAVLMTPLSNKAS